MKFEACGDRAYVTLTYPTAGSVWRTRRYPNCGNRFTTQELVDEPPVPMWKMVEERRRATESYEEGG